VIEDVVDAAPFLRVFPEPAEVFADPALAEHVLPLVSIDLAVVDPSSAGWIHLVTPFEPPQGYLGEYTTAFHNDALSVNWLAFECEPDGRYRLAGDLRYFARADESFVEPWPGYLAEAHEIAGEERAAHDAARYRYGRDGALSVARRDDPLERDEGGKYPLALVDQIGGPVGAGNWAESVPDGWFAGGFDAIDPDDVRLVDAAGRPIVFVAGVPGWHYGEHGADWIMLFYEASSRRAYLTFDYS
jgi:hypothetical protein